MNKWGWAETLALISIVIAIAAFAQPEVRCVFGLPSESCSNQQSHKNPVSSTPESTPNFPREDD